jgi:hypothetical protein
MMKLAAQIQTLSVAAQITLRLFKRLLKEHNRHQYLRRKRTELLMVKKVKSKQLPKSKTAQ